MGPVIDHAPAQGFEYLHQPVASLRTGHQHRLTGIDERRQTRHQPGLRAAGQQCALLVAVLAPR